MDKRQALQEAAKVVAGWVYATGPDELFPGFDEYSEADQDRLEWAQGEVMRRLYAMGERR
jgi:hypothetical protein